MRENSTTENYSLDDLVTGSYEEILVCCVWLKDVDHSRSGVCNSIKNAISANSGSMELRHFALQRCREMALSFVETAQASEPLSCLASIVAERVQLPLKEMRSAVAALANSAGELPTEAIDRLIGASDIWVTEFKHITKLLVAAGAGRMRLRASVNATSNEKPPTDEALLAKYQDPLTPLGKRILKSLWNSKLHVSFQTLRTTAWEGEQLESDSIKRRLQDIEKRWMGAGLLDIDLEISPANESVKLKKLFPIPADDLGDKKGDN